MKFLKEEDKAVTKTIDARVKNKWSWTWPEFVVEQTFTKSNGDVSHVKYKLKDCISKVDEAGVSWCHWCKDKVHYKNGGRHWLVIQLQKDIKVLPKRTMRSLN